MPKSIGLVVLFLLGVPCLAPAQVCPQSKPDVAEIIKMIRQASHDVEGGYGEDFEEGANVVYRSAAIGGTAAVPALKRIARPGFSPSTLAGAAQVSLAKLGDPASLAQIERELRQDDPYALQKLTRIGDDKAVAILMKAMLKIPPGTSWVRGGDVIVIPQTPILEALKPIVRNPPAPFDSNPEHLGVWKSWWTTNKNKHVAWSIDSGMFSQDPRLECLARKVQWGFPEAILDLAQIGGSKTAPVLKNLLDLRGENRDTRLGTVPGNAQTALAMLGDKNEFDAIAQELDTADYRDAVEKLRLLGNRSAVEALVGGLDSVRFEEYKTRNVLATPSVVEREELIVEALTSLVVPPSGTHLSTKENWKNWWQQNGSSAGIRKTPRRTQE